MMPIEINRDPRARLQSARPKSAVRDNLFGKFHTAFLARIATDFEADIAHGCRKSAEVGYLHEKGLPFHSHRANYFRLARRPQIGHHGRSPLTTRPSLSLDKLPH